MRTRMQSRGSAARIGMTALALLTANALAADGAPGTDAKPVDVTAELRQLNSDDYVAPATTYRAGHVTPRQFAGKVTVTQAGFEIQLPGNYPIPTPAVQDGRLYVSGGFGTKQFYCFEAATGKFIWGTDLDDDGATSAVVEDNVVVFNTESCTLFACDATTGKMLWSYWLGDPLTTTPAIAKGRVYSTYPANGQGGGQQANNSGGGKAAAAGRKATGLSHVMGCFDLKTGKILWQQWVDGDAMSAPVAVDDEVYITTFPGTVFKFDAKSGEILSAVRARATAAPTVVGKEVFFTRRTEATGKAREAIATNDRKRLALADQYNEKPAEYLEHEVQARSQLAMKAQSLDAGNGFASAPAASGYTQAAKNVGQSHVSTMQSFQGSRILSYAGRNYNCMGDELLCTDPKTQKTEWRVKLKGDLKDAGGFLGAPPALAGEQLILATLDGRVLQVDPKTGAVLKEHQIKSPLRFQATAVDGRLYVGTQDGRLVCIDTGDKTVSGWPMWGGNAAHTGVAGK